ncbi:EmrB/QacA subfamily drug resistance transporter [Haloactinopolyspora alba]|uniref:EmrB/QacA subfamily drug resistance transporter n=1 Tax=Haloactinopolyspora alba TaxID=648780 RepID=A0A2P8DYT5_9ACTN|nr:DHA2 family efflux MFS transporter permease subunit [Haloactinopolyspora alba]PSL02371.1 EmrB/QacA subfamily drug resistance transporter [Haloactinopolyspora alba]
MTGDRSGARPVTTVFLACSMPTFMAGLDNLVAVTSLNVIRLDLGADAAHLQWISTAYMVAFAGLLLVAAGLGDRWGRRRVFVTGIVVFTAASLACGLAETTTQLIAARAVQGVGAATLTPLSLTILAGAVPERRRGLAVGLWSAANGAAISLGPLAGGAIAEGLDWRWVFWINVPIGVAAVVLARSRLPESRGAASRIDAVGMAAACAAIVAAIWAVVNAPERGWTSGPVLVAAVVALLAAVFFTRWERRTEAPLLPPRLYRIRSFTLTNLVTLCMHVGVFGSIFLLAQLLQVAHGYGPFDAGLRTMAWTVMPMLVAPVAGVLTQRIGGGPLMAGGLALQAAGLAWIASTAAPGQPFTEIVGPMVVAGTGMGLVFAPTAAVVLSSVRPEEHGLASGANTTVRELGGALGIAVLGTVFQARGGYADPQRFVDGVTAALWVAVPVVAVGAVLALLIPRGSGATGGATVQVDDVSSAGARSR